MIILHGDNQVQSREAFLQAKTQAQKTQNLTNLNGDELTLLQLTQVVETVSLFGERPTVVIEGFFARRPSNAKKEVIEYLEKNSQIPVIFWDGKDVTTQLKNFPPAIIKKFDLPKLVFRFLDTLSLSDFQATIQNTAPELVFSLLAGHIRKLIMVEQNAINLPAWQSGKLKSQAKKIGLSKLLTMHQDLLKLDYQQKTSTSALNLSSGLELWLIKAFN